ncbi:hypothetical protein L3V83_03795 [Thiotrichales bacterium 19X7-9]|nr:hypothetical protein [Thiotrichales bacterium 19X7-9]
MKEEIKKLMTANVIDEIRKFIKSQGFTELSTEEKIEILNDQRLIPELIKILESEEFNGLPSDRKMAVLNQQNRFGQPVLHVIASLHSNQFDLTLNIISSVSDEQRIELANGADRFGNTLLDLYTARDDQFASISKLLPKSDGDSDLNQYASDDLTEFKPEEEQDPLILEEKNIKSEPPYLMNEMQKTKYGCLKHLCFGL